MGNIVTAEVIHTALLMCALENLKTIKATGEGKDILEKKDKLESLGLTKSKTYVDIAEKSKQFERKKVYNYFNENFDGVYIIPLRTFTYLLLKYDLYVSTFDNYVGEIPDDNINEILETKIKLESLEDNVYSNRNISLLRHVRTNNLGEFYKRCGLPALAEVEEAPENISTRNIGKSPQTLKAAMSSYILKYTTHSPSFGMVDISINSDSDVERYFIHSKTGAAILSAEYSYPRLTEIVKHLPIVSSDTHESTCVSLTSKDLLIAAPYPDIVNHLVVERPMFVPLDPFVFQIVNDDVIIFSKWGEEANDEVFDA